MADGGLDGLTMRIMLFSPAGPWAWMSLATICFFEPLYENPIVTSDPSTSAVIFYKIQLSVSDNTGNWILRIHHYFFDNI